MIEGNLNDLENLASSFHEMNTGATRLGLSVDFVDDYEKEAIDRHTSLTIKYANQAIKNGCVDEADQVCRRLLEFYTGTAYASIRDRAMVCIDDVRAARQSNLR